MNKLIKFFWVILNFKTPLVFLNALFSRTGSGVVVQMRNGLRFFIRRNHWDAEILMEMFFDKPYVQEREVAGVVVDIGAYVGDFSIFAAKEYGAKVVAFEPFPDNFEIAKKNVQLNNLAGLVHLYNCAVGSSDGLILHVSRDGDGVHVTSAPHEGSKETRVPCIDLAEVLRLAGGRVGLLKVDCEGSEYAIFEKASVDNLMLIDAISMEYHRVDGWEKLLQGMCTKFEVAGFSVCVRGEYVFCRR